MLQAVTRRPEHLVFQKVPIPKPEKGQALVAVKCLGICRSEVHAYYGKHPFTSYPIIQGHEFSAEVVSVGESVENLNPGDKVTADPQATCGTCSTCRVGRYNICETLKVWGFQVNGVASEYCILPIERTIRLPEEITYEQGAFLEPLSVAVHAAHRIGGKNNKVAVIGAGTIGLLVAQVLKSLGAQRVMICDMKEKRLRLAKNLGIGLAVNIEKQPLEDIIDSEFGPEGADCMVECAGSQSALESAVSNARNGSRVVALGVYPTKPKIEMGFIVERELELIGSMMYTRQDWLRAISLIKDKKVKVDPLVTHRFDFKDYPEAYRVARENSDEAVKIMIKVS